jgi:hypothetical protein
VEDAAHGVAGWIEQFRYSFPSAAGHTVRLLHR